MDIFDPTMAVPVDSAPSQHPKGKGKGPANDQGALVDAPSDQAQQPAQDQSLEQEVQQLVAGVSSWWSGFSHKSQQQLEAARAHIQEQGGLVALAKKEAQKFEASMTEAQRLARDRALQPAPLTEEEKARINAAAREKGAGEEEEEEDGKLDEKGKGKGKATEPKSRSVVSGDASATTVSGSSVGEELFDAEREANKSAAGDATVSAPSRSSQDFARVAALSTGAALGSAQAWFSKVQSTLKADPTLASMQKSLADTVASFNANSNSGAKANNGGDGGGGVVEKGTLADVKSSGGTDEEEAAKREAVLPHLASTIKAALPHLTWDRSQEMARKYYNDAGSVVRELGKEVKVMAEDLVKIVPPTREEERRGEEGEAKGEGEKGSGDAKGREIDDDLGSDWDVDVESEAPPTPLEATSGGTNAGIGASKTGSDDTPGIVTTQPQGISNPKPDPKGDLSGTTTAKDHVESALKTTTTTATAKAPSMDKGKDVTLSASGKKGEDGEEDEDSDWE